MIQLGDWEIVKLLGKKPENKKEMDLYRYADKLARANAQLKQFNRFDSAWQRQAPILAYLDTVPPTNVGYLSSNDTFDLDAAKASATTIHYCTTRTQFVTALASAIPGDVIQIQDSVGTTTWASVTINCNGTSSAPIVICAETPMAGVVFTNTSQSFPDGMFNFSGASYVVMHGLRFRDWTFGARIIRVGSPNIRITKCEFYNNKNSAEWLRVDRYSSDFELDHNLCHAIGEVASSNNNTGRFYFIMPDPVTSETSNARFRSGTTAWPISENPINFHVHHNTSQGAYGAGCIWLQFGQASYFFSDSFENGLAGDPSYHGGMWQSGGIFEYNEVGHAGSSPEAPTIKIGDIDFRYNYYTGNQSVIYQRAGLNNRIYGNYRVDSARGGSSLLGIIGAENLLMHSNIAVQTGSSVAETGIRTQIGGYRSAGDSSYDPVTPNKDCIFANNTIIADSAYLTLTGVYHNLDDSSVTHQRTPPSGCQFINNLIVYTGSKAASIIGTAGGGPTSTTVMNNLVNCSAGVGDLFHGSVGLLTSAPNLDSIYQPNAGSPARGAGTWVTGTDTDIYGNARIPGSPIIDIGAVQVSSIVPPPDAGVKINHTSTSLAIGATREATIFSNPLVLSLVESVKNFFCLLIRQGIIK